MNLYLIQIGMTISVVCFSIGYYFRIRNNAIHVISNSFGVGFNLLSTALLLTMKYGLGGLELFGIQAAVEMWVVHTHRAFAAITFLMMLGMAYTGITRQRKIHIFLHRFFVPLYLVVYISGLFIFETTGESFYERNP